MPEPVSKTATPFVGREPELSQLHQALQTVINSKKHEFVLVQADYGVGKTALVEHFLTEASSQNSHILIGLGKCAMENESSGLVPFAHLFTSLTNQGIKRLVVLGDLFKFAKEVAPAWLDIVTAGAASATVKTVEESRKLLGSNAFSQENVFVQFTNALSRLAEKHPVIAFIDDLHWADASSLGLLFHLARNLQDRAVLFIITYRPVEAMQSSVNAALFREIRVNLIRYGASELEIRQGIDVAQYVAQRYPLNAFPSDLINRVQEITGGHALFVSQVFSLWEDKRTIAANPTSNGLSEWRVADNANVEFVIPQTLSQVLAERIRSMADELREILVCASVEGEDFTVQTIARLRRLNEIKVCDSLELLDHHYYLIKETETKQIGLNVFDFYRFAHRFFREHIYNQLAAGKKRVLHRQVAECLETLYTDRSEIAGQLARHFREALDLMKSAQYALMAAQFEQSHYSWTEGEQWCAFGLDAVSKLSQDTETLMLHLDLAEQSGCGNYYAGKYSHAGERYLEALNLAEQLHAPPTRIADDCIWLSDIYEFEGRYEEAIEFVERGRQTLIRAGLSVGEIQIALESAYGFMQTRLGNDGAAVQCLHKALSDAESLPETPYLEDVKAEIHNSLGIALGHLARYSEAIAAYQEAANARCAHGHESSAAVSLLNIANLYLRMQAPDQANDYIARGMQLAERAGRRTYMVYGRFLKGAMALASGKFYEARQELEQVIEISLEFNALWYMPTMYATLALAYLATADVLAAYRHARLAVDYASKTSLSQFEAGDAYDALGQVETAQADWESAKLHFAQAIAVYQDSGSRHYAARSQCHFAEMLIAQGNRQEAIELLKVAMEVFQELGLSAELTKTQELLNAAAV